MASDGSVGRRRTRLLITAEVSLVSSSSVGARTGFVYANMLTIKKEQNNENISPPLHGSVGALVLCDESLGASLSQSKSNTSNW